MNLLNEKDAKYIVRHTVTEKKLLHLERGVRRLGYQRGGSRIVLGLAGLSAVCLLASAAFDGAVSGTLLAMGILALIVVLVCLYSLLKGWQEAKREIHLQYELGKGAGNYDWEYRFFESCYEVIGKNETSRVQYSHIGRLLEFSGMYALVEKGNVIRYFEKADVARGDADELAVFLENKCRLRMELIRVRG